MFWRREKQASQGRREPGYRGVSGRPRTPRGAAFSPPKRGVLCWPKRYANCGVARRLVGTRYCSHKGSTLSTATMIQTLSWGRVGGWRSLIPTSSGDRFSLRELHVRHAATTLSQVWPPPRLVGMM
jgi:hypothetical protein